MDLYINTASQEKVIISLKLGEIVFDKEFPANFNQAEKLLPEVEKLLKKAGKDLGDIKRIRVANQGGTFTSLRIGIVTANALAYALGIPVADEQGKSQQVQGLEVVEPKYNHEPNIM